MKRIIYIVFLTFAATACVKSSKEYKALLQEKDSLVAVNARTHAEFDAMLSILNEVEEGLTQIKKQEGVLSLESQNMGEPNQTTRDKITSDFQLITETLENNRTKLTQLEKQLKNSQFQSAELRKRIEKLSREVDEQSQTILVLKDELMRRDQHINLLKDTVSGLSQQVGHLSQESDSQKAIIQEQEKKLNAVWYVFGTRDELKEHDIISGGGLFSSTKVLESNFDKSYFIEENMLKLKMIHLYAKKAKILSNHPEGSYHFFKDDNGNQVLLLEDPKLFWSLTRYLVVQVN